MKIDQQAIKKICMAVRSDLNEREIHRDSLLIEDLGFESISLIALVIELERLLNRDLSKSAEKMMDIKTPGDLLDFVGAFCVSKTGKGN